MPISASSCFFGTAMNKELFEAAEIAKFNPKELGEYWESLKNFRDWYSVMSTQLKKVLSKVVKEECFKECKKNENRPVLHLM